MRFSNADRPGEKQALAGGIDGVCLNEFARGKMRATQRLIGAAECCLVAIERVLAVSLGDAGGCEPTFFAIGILTLACARHPQTGVGFNADQAYAVADFAYTHGSFKRSAIAEGAFRWERRAASWKMRAPGCTFETAARR